MGHLVEMLTTGCEYALAASLVALPVAGLVLLIDLSIGRHFAAKYRTMLWLVVVLRLLIPPATFGPSSSLSLQNAFGSVIPFAFATPGESETSLYHAYRADGGRAATRHILDKPALHAWRQVPVGSDRTASSASDVWTEGDRPTAAPIPDRVPGGSPTSKSTWRWHEIIAVIWGSVAIAIFVRGLLSSFRFARRIGKVPECEDQRLIDQLLRVCDRLRAGPRPRLKLVPGISSPLIFGLRRPTLCLPAEQMESLTPKELELIMLHEVSHMRRRDAVVAWLLTLTRALHWYNPIAWLAAAKVSRFSEQACDHTVVRHVRASDRPTYADILIRFASSRTSPSLGLLGLWFAARHGQMKSRIREILRMPTSRPVWQTFSALCVVSAVAVAGLTDPREAGAVRSSAAAIPDLPPMPRMLPAIGMRSGGPPKLVEKSYNIARAISMLRERNLDTNEEPTAAYLLVPPLCFSPPLPSESGATPIQTDRHWHCDGDSLTLRTTQQQHRQFERHLRHVEQVGLWQVAIGTRVIRASNALASSVGIDWDSAARVKLNSRIENFSPMNRDLADLDGADGISMHVEAMTHAFTPHLAQTIDTATANRLVEECQSNARANIRQAPSVTLFSSQLFHMCDESQRPFVVGVEAIRAENVTCHQPQIAVLSEGLRMRVRPTVREDGTLDLVCEIIESSISGVDTVELPSVGASDSDERASGVSVQSPNAKSVVVSIGCRLKEGESLVIASPSASFDGTGRSLSNLYLLTPCWWED